MPTNTLVVDTSGSQPGLDLATDIVKRGGLDQPFGWIKGQSALFETLSNYPIFLCLHRFILSF